MTSYFVGVLSSWHYMKNIYFDRKDWEIGVYYAFAAPVAFTQHLISVHYSNEQHSTFQLLYLQNNGRILVD